VNQSTWTDGAVVKQSLEPVAVEVDRTVVMMSVAREKYYSLSGVGGRIWALLDDAITVEELCARLMTEFDVSPAECRSDVEEFLTHLLDEGLIEVDREASDSLRPPSTS
jgi:hypothetical protein